MRFVACCFPVRKSMGTDSKLLRKREPRQSAAWLLIVLALAVFVAEALVMVVLPLFPSMPVAMATIIDATLLSVLLFPLFYLLVFRPLTMNIKERKAAEARLQLAANVFTHAREAILITDAQGSIIEVNDTFSQITGYSYEEALGKNLRMFQTGLQPPEFYAGMWKALVENGHWSGEMWNRRKNGQEYAEMITISAVQDANKVTQNYVALITDITSMKEHQDRLERIAHFDALTGLPNRVLLADRLQQAMAQSQRRKQSLAVAFLDLDGFKTVNDTHGHKIGDELLTVVSQRMRLALREADTLARIGGDEFVAVLVDLEGREWEPLLARLLQAASVPVQIDDLVLCVSTSIGVTLYPEDSADADTLIRHADQAMYLAKQAGKNLYRVYEVVRQEG